MAFQAEGRGNAKVLQGESVAIGHAQVAVHGAEEPAGAVLSCVPVSVLPRALSTSRLCCSLECLHVCVPTSCLLDSCVQRRCLLDI